MDLYDNPEWGHGNRPLYGTRLNPKQFGSLTAHYSLRLPKNAPWEQNMVGYHEIKLFDKDSDQVGRLEWHKDRGEVLNINVHPEYQRKGVATAMWNMAHQLSSEYGVTPPQHSADRSDNGEAWAKTTGASLPKRLKLSDFPGMNSRGD